MTRPFTQQCLAAIHLFQAARCTQAEMAFTLGRSPAEIDRAVWAMLGTSIPDAVIALNRPRLVEGAAA